jgi:hypothetical protein
MYDITVARFPCFDQEALLSEPPSGPNPTSWQGDRGLTSLFLKEIWAIKLGTVAQKSSVRRNKQLYQVSSRSVVPEDLIAP